jgi:hypothetical protein
MDREAVEQFIKDKELTFVSAKDTGQFWGGLDRHADQVYELFLTGDQESPSVTDIARYHSLLENFDQIIADIYDRTKQYLVSRGQDMWGKFEDSKLELSIIGLDESKSEGELDILGSMRGRGFIFKKQVSFCASVTDNRVTHFDIS